MNDADDIKLPALQRQMMRAMPHLTKKDFNQENNALYVVMTPEILKWIQHHYPFYKNIRGFFGTKNAGWSGSGKKCLEIPMAGFVTLQN